MMGDHLVRGLGLGGRVRAVAADTTAVVRELRRIHEPTRTVTTARRSSTSPHARRAISPRRSPVSYASRNAGRASSS